MPFSGSLRRRSFLIADSPLCAATPYWSGAGTCPLRLSHRTVLPRRPGVETYLVSRCRVGRLRDETPVVDVLQVFAEAFENFDFFSFGDLAFQFVQGEVNDIVVVNLLPH